MRYLPLKLGIFVSKRVDFPRLEKCYNLSSRQPHREKTKFIRKVEKLEKRLPKTNTTFHPLLPYYSFFPRYLP